MRRDSFDTEVRQLLSSINAALRAKKSTNEMKVLLDDYRQHWVTWVYSGIPSSIIKFDSETKLRLYLKST